MKKVNNGYLIMNHLILLLIIYLFQILLWIKLHIIKIYQKKQSYMKQHNMMKLISKFIHI